LVEAISPASSSTEMCRITVGRLRPVGSDNSVTRAVEGYGLDQVEAAEVRSICRQVINETYEQAQQAMVKQIRQGLADLLRDATA